MKKIFFSSLFLLVAIIISLFIWYSRINYSVFNDIVSSSNIVKIFEIKQGEGSEKIGRNLKKEGLIKDSKLFYFYIWKTKTASLLQAGEYEVSPNMTIGEMVEKFTNGDIVSRTVKLVVPEGYSNKKITKTLEQKKPEIADEFEKIVNCKCLNRANCDCDIFSEKYEILQGIPNGIDMEGYLFPDTYFIDDDETGITLVSKFLNNFNKKVDIELKTEITEQGKTLHQIITLASIVEREVKTESDRKLTAGIFWQRLEDEFPLQSCATLAYFLGIDKPQFSYEDTRKDSPYNTYLNSGLPPGPISNPGVASIRAVIFPEQSDYYYFLSNPETGEIIYTKTIEEHNRKKAENNL